MFLAPLFLMGLIAIGVPIWLHRVARANPVQHTFPSLMLLEAAETQRTAKRTIRYWLLLLARILLLALLVFAFAGPLWNSDRAPALAADARLHAIVLDASLSMQHQDRWSNALGAAQSVLQSLDSADQVMLVKAAGRRMDVVQEPVSAREAGAVRAALQSLQPSVERTDFGYMMSSAEQWLRTPRPPVMLHVISDFQQSGAPLRFADLEPPAGSQLLMHDVGSADHGNVYIEEVSLSEGNTRSLEVRVRSTFAEPQSRVLVLSIDGKESARRNLALAPLADAPAANVNVAGEGGGLATQPLESTSDAARASAEPERAEVIFENVEFAPGAHRIELRIEPQDALAQDDRFFAVVEHANPKALLLAPDADSDEATYFAAAIGALTAPQVEVDRKPASGFDQGDLGHYAILVVPDVYALSSSAAERVEQYVSAGGAVLTTLGAQSHEAVHPLFSSWRIEEPRPRLAQIGSIDASHPILRDTPLWHRVRFFRQRSVQPDPSDRVLIAHEDGAPLLIERTVGAGRMLVLTAPIDRAWNDLAIHPVFVQFISQATRYLIGHDSSTVSVAVGTPVTTGLTRVAGGQIFDPNGGRVLDLAAMSNTDRLVPTQLGFYEIRHANGTRWLAVNTDRRESDLRRLAPDYLARWQALRQRTPAPVEQPTAATHVQTHSLGPMLLWLAALVLLVELLLANRYLAVRREVAR